MINYKKKVRIFHNGKPIRQLKLKPDNNVMTEEFRKTRDRVFIVSNILDFELL